MKSSEEKDWVLGKNASPLRSDFSNQIAFDDHKIAFAIRHCSKKDVLDLGCVQHNPENYKSRFWLHKALREVSGTLLGMDIYEPGVAYLREQGFNVVPGDVQSFDLGRKFDVIVAGDLIEHLDNLGGFLASCRKHLRPGGVLLISTPNPWYWRNIAKAAVRGRVSNNLEHTLWLDPVTLSQLARRYDLAVEEVEFGSRYKRDLLLPLPRGIKHGSFHAVLRLAAN
jgi:2-polyprenyl-3-methyl-5-hydroxy-6-metoxy-1,4-benzoquinol methylase